MWDSIAKFHVTFYWLDVSIFDLYCKSRKKWTKTSILIWSIAHYISICKWCIYEPRSFRCPYLPENPDDDVSSASTDFSSARLLVLTHGNTTEMWNIDMVLRDHNAGAVITSDSVTNGKLVVCDHSDAIRDASFR